MTLCVRWKKSVKLTIVLDPEDVECAKDISNYIDDESIEVKCHLTAFFGIQRMRLPVKKTQSSTKKRDLNPRPLRS